MKTFRIKKWKKFKSFTVFNSFKRGVEKLKSIFLEIEKGNPLSSAKLIKKK